MIQVRVDITILSLKAGNSGRVSMVQAGRTIPFFSIFALEAISRLDEAYISYVGWGVGNLLYLKSKIVNVNNTLKIPLLQLLD